MEPMEEEPNILTREELIYEKRLQTAQDYPIDKPCCDEDEVKIINTHGKLMNEVIHLPEGYKIILLAELGKCIRSGSYDKTKLRSIYSEGHTIFQNNDTIPKLTTKGSKWVKSLQSANSDISDGVNPTLYVGRDSQNPVVDIEGDSHYIPVNIPNIYLEFYGDNCDDWGGSKQLSCMVSCIKEGYEPSGEDSFCDKYYGKKITLFDLLKKEGKGTYVISTCLAIINYPPNIKETILTYFNSLKIIQNPHIKTRIQHIELLKHLKVFDDLSKLYTPKTLYGKVKKINNNKKSINLKRLQNKAKKIKLRITKTVRGKRIYKTIIELKNQIKKKIKN